MRESGLETEVLGKVTRAMPSTQDDTPREREGHGEVEDVGVGWTIDEIAEVEDDVVEEEVNDDERGVWVSSSASVVQFKR